MEKIKFNIQNIEIDKSLYKKGFIGENSPLQCDGACCKYGVYVDINEKEKILAHSKLIKKYFDETQNLDSSKWFEEKEVEDTDFPSKKCVGTEVFNDKCVFLNKNGKCVLQQTAIAEKMHPWELKPFYCIAFPLTVVDKKIEWDDMLQGEKMCCSAFENFSTNCVTSCKIELDYILGNSGNEVLKTKHNEL